ncbi:MAG: HAMP domain-containing protein [Xanthobacteraceae bacterium]
MPAFKVPIAAKVAALGLLSIAANALCLQRFHELERLNAEPTEHAAPARLALAEAKTSLESFGLAVYKTYSASDPDQVKESLEAIESNYGAAKNALNNVASYAPATAEDVKRIESKLEFAHGVAAELKNALRASDRAAAQRIVDLRFDPARDDVTAQLNHLINILGGQGPSTEADVTARSAAMVHTTVGILAAGTAAALIGALILSHIFIAIPLRRMAEMMRRMARGDLHSPIHGSRRSDEIGAMARTVENGAVRDQGQDARGRQRDRGRARGRCGDRAIHGQSAADLGRDFGVGASAGHGDAKARAKRRQRRRSHRARLGRHRRSQRIGWIRVCRRSASFSFVRDFLTFVSSFVIAGLDSAIHAEVRLG